MHLGAGMQGGLSGLCSECCRLCALPRPGLLLPCFLAHHQWRHLLLASVYMLEWGGAFLVHGGWWLPCGFFFSFCLLAHMRLVVAKFGWGYWKEIIFASCSLNPSFAQVRSPVRRKKLVNYLHVLQTQCFVLWARRHPYTLFLPFNSLSVSCLCFSGKHGHVLMLACSWYLSMCVL